jgi:microcystin degradation protein MlrC
MRIAVGGFMHETNTFVAQPTAWEDFVRAGPWPTVTEGAPILTVFRNINLAIAHFMDAAEKAGHEMVPLAWGAAQPSGCVTDDAFERISKMILDGLEREKPDAVFLELHGAMVTQSLEDGEGELLRRVRALVGP